jgi:hypothetical protein
VEKAGRVMNPTMEAQITDAEDRLRAAMLSSDVEVLTELFAPDLIFTNHLGQLQSRESDLAAYRPCNRQIFGTRRLIHCC